MSLSTFFDLEVQNAVTARDRAFARRVQLKLEGSTTSFDFIYFLMRTHPLMLASSTRYGMFLGVFMLGNYYRSPDMTKRMFRGQSLKMWMTLLPIVLAANLFIDLKSLEGTQVWDAYVFIKQFETLEWQDLLGLELAEEFRYSEDFINRYSENPNWETMNKYDFILDLFAFRLSERDDDMDVF